MRPNFVSQEPSGDRVLVTAEFPAHAITYTTSDSVAITLDDQDWRQRAQGVLESCGVAEMHVDPGIVALRAEHALVEAADQARQERPGDRRYAVAEVLRRLADLVESGTVRGLNAEWSAHDPVESASVDVWLRTKRSSTSASIQLTGQRQEIAK